MLWVAGILNTDVWHSKYKIAPLRHNNGEIMRAPNLDAGRGAETLLH